MGTRAREWCKAIERTALMNDHEKVTGLALDAFFAEDYGRVVNLISFMGFPFHMAAD